MTDFDPTDNAQPDERPAQSHTGSEHPLTPSRRRLVQTLTSGGSLLLAGCGLFESGSPSGKTDGQQTPAGSASTDDMPQVQGQTFRAPIGQDPAKTAVYRRHDTIQDQAYSRLVKEPASFGLRLFLRPPGVWVKGRFLGSRPGAGLQYTSWIEEAIEKTPTEVTFTIRDDAKWSDGHPITGIDLALRRLEVTLSKFLVPPPAYAPESPDDGHSEGSNEPPTAVLAFDDFEIRDKSVTYRSEAGHFEKFTEKAIATSLGPILPPFSPTHIAPFDAFADAVIETVRRAQAGDIYPWYRPEEPGSSESVPRSLQKEYLADVKHIRKFSKPENVLSTGAWDLVAVDGKDFVFEPNSYHRLADVFNFETVRFGFAESAKRQRAALKDNRLDVAMPGLTPQTIIDAFPTNIKTIRIPSAFGGNELAMNFDHPALTKRKVRLAIMYALDQQTIANNIHQSATVPVTTPGGDCWDATEYVSQDWIDTNFTTYPTDREEAAKLMGEAGYTREGGKWVDVNSEPLTLTLPTPSGTPKWEPAVASQLTAFGIDTQVKTLGGNVFYNRLDAGEFAIWPSSATATAYASGTLGIWNDAASKPGDKKYGIYPDEQFETGEFTEEGTPVPRTEERYRVFTIQAPPIGQPDGQLREYHPAAVADALQKASVQEFHRRVKIGMWLANWFLPTIPINKQYSLRFIDKGHWLWPTDSPAWKNFTGGDFRPLLGLLGNLALRANPNNPEEGASVVEQ